MEQSYPKISLVTTCYNHKDFISETIESVLNQGYPNLEYIVIDDGSTDGSWEVIQRYKDRLAQCERMEGYRDTPTIALNYGFSKTTGGIMGWLNSDDVLLRNSLFTIAKVFFDQQPVIWVTGMASTINHRSEVVNAVMRYKNVYDFLLNDWKVIQQESTFWRRSLWEKAGAHLEGKHRWAFDTELWTRFFFLADHVHVAAPIGAFRKGMQSKSIENKDSFLIPNAAYLRAMKERAGSGMHLRAWIYLVMKWLFYPLSVMLPTRIFLRLPFVRFVCYKELVYSFEADRWISRYVFRLRK